MGNTNHVLYNKTIEQMFDWARNHYSDKKNWLITKTEREGIKLSFTVEYEDEDNYYSGQ